MWIYNHNTCKSKIVQERVRNALEAISLGNDFLRRTQMAQQLREMIEK
jgi:hypothetical protein